MPDNHRELIPVPLDFDRVHWYAIDQNPLFSNPRRLPNWRIRKIAGNPYIWGARRFTTFDGARLFVVDSIAEWRRTYGKDEEACRRVSALDDYRSALLLEEVLHGRVTRRRFPDARNSFGIDPVR